MKKIILAVVGLTGSGKTEIVEYLIKKTGWPKVYFGDVTFNEMKKREIEINETNERKMREEIREKFGMEAYATLSLPKIKEAYVNSSVIVESLYSWEEYLEMKKEFVILSALSFALFEYEKKIIKKQPKSNFFVLIKNKNK